MSNIRGLGDLNNNPRGGGDSGGGGGGLPPGGMGPGGNPGQVPPGGFLGFFGSMFGGGGGPQGGGPGGGGEGRVKALHSDAEFGRELSAAGNRLVVVDFFATWCGPCKMISPMVAQLSNEYTEVVFLKVDVDQMRGTAAQCGISAMPTFQFYHRGNKIEEFKGADGTRLRQLVAQLSVGKGGGASAPSGGSGGQTLGSGGGQTLGEGNTLGSGVLGSRLLAGQDTQQPTRQEAQQTTTQSQAPEPPQESVPPQESAPMQVEQVQSQPVPQPQAAPLAAADPVMVQNLIEMGFPQVRAEKALGVVKNASVQAAMDWIFEHMDDPDIDTPSATPAAPSALSQDELEVQRISQSKELTPEERAEQVARLQQKILEVRKKKREDEETRDREREISRRREGQNAADAKKKWEDAQVAREAEKIRKEKEADKRAQAAIRAKIAADKAERAAKKEQPAAAQQQAPPAVQAAAPAPAKEYTESQLQVRLTDGSVLRATFKPTDTMRTVQDYVKGARKDGGGNFALATTFPRKVYQGAELNVSLKDAGLVPNGTLVLQKL